MALAKSDFSILKFLSKNLEKKFNTSELSKKLSLDKSTVQRSVKKLYEKNLISRFQINQSVGGYLFLYYVKDKEEINSMILGIVNNWYKTVEENIKKW